MPKLAIADESVSQIPSTSTSTTVTASGYDYGQDGFLNFDRLNETRIPSGYRLWASNAGSRKLMEILGDSKHLGKGIPCLIFLNDMSVPYEHKQVSNKGRVFKNASGKKVTLSKKALEEVQAAIDEDYVSYQEEQESNLTLEEIKRIEEFGKVLGYLNVFFYEQVGDEIQLVRVPGSMALRQKRAKDRSTFIQQRHLGIGVGEECLAKFYWADKSRNTHAGTGGRDFSGILGL